MRKLGTAVLLVIAVALAALLLRPSRMEPPESAPAPAPVPTAVPPADAPRAEPRPVAELAQWIAEGTAFDDATSAPLAGARIAAARPAQDGLRAIVAEVRTAADGTWRLELGPTAVRERLELFAMADGHATEIAEAEELSARALGSRRLEWNPRLVAEAPAAGMVVDESGVPIAGAEVLVQHSAIAGGRLQLLHALEPVRTAQDGTFAIGGLAAGRKAAVSARAPDCAESEPYSFAPPNTSLRIVLSRLDAELLVSVADHTGAPVAGAPVSAVSPERSGATSRFESLTGPDGTCRGRVRSGVLMVDAGKGGAKPHAFEIVTAKAGEVTQVALAYPKPIAISGIVVEEGSGLPLAGVAIRAAAARPATPAEAADGLYATSGADGRFALDYYPKRFEDPKSGAVFARLPDSFGIDAGEAVPAWFTPAVLQGEPLRIEIPRGGLVEGRALLPDGVTPAAGAQVDFLTSGKPGVAMVFSDWNESVRADAEGRFRLPVRPSDDLWVMARTPGHYGGHSVAFRRDAPPRPISVILQELGSVDVRVQDAAGQPVAGATVSIRGEWGFERAAGNSGRVAIELPAGTYSLAAEAPGMVLDADVPVRVRHGESVSANLLLVAGSRLDGIVVDQDGAPVAGARVAYGILRSRGGGELEVRTGADGKFALDGVPYSADAGRGIVAKHPDYGTVEVANVGASAGPLRIEMAKLIEVELLGIGADSRTVEKFHYTIAPTGMPAGRPPAFGTASGGRATARLPRGAYMVTATEPAGAGRRADAEFDIGATIPRVYLEFADSETIAGVVLDASGAPVGGATVVAMPNEPKPGMHRGGRGDFDAVSGPDGRFAIEGAYPGSWRVVAAKDYAESEQVPVMLPSKGEELTLRLEPTGSLLVKLNVPDAGRFSLSLMKIGGSAAGIQPREKVGPDGTKLIERISSGRYFVSAFRSANTFEPAMRGSVEVEAGRQAVLELDEEGRVTMEGSLTCAGGPVSQSRGLMLQPIGGPSPGKLDAVGIWNLDGGRYSVRIHPGRYMMIYNGTSAGELEVPDGVQTFEHDFHLDGADVDVLFALPEGTPLRDIEVLLRPSDGTGWGAAQHHVNARAVSFACLPAGEYKAFATLADGTQFASDPTPIGPGRENIVTVYKKLELELPDPGSPGGNPFEEP